MFDNEVLTVIDIEDENIKYVKLSLGLYLIDDKIVSVETYGNNIVSVNDVDNIRYVTKNKIVEKYTNGEDFISSERYEIMKIQLFEKQIKNSYGDLVFATLEDEYAYKKFKQIWTPIYKEIQTFSDPIKVSIIKEKYNTGNEYIEPMFLNDNYIETKRFYKYDRAKALFNIIIECFNELGMKFAENVDYHGTKSKKIWSNSKTGGIRWITAFGTYLFSDVYGSDIIPVYGKLDDLLDKYNKDKTECRNIIISKYKIHFESIDFKKPQIEKIINDLNVIKNRILEIDSKKNTDNSRTSALKQTKDLLDYLESIILYVKE